MMSVMAERLAVPTEAVSGVGDFNGWMIAEQRRIFLLCQRFLQDRDEADSATQDVFLKAYRALQKPGSAELDSPEKWLTRIAVNTCLDRLRSRTWKFWKKRPEPETESTILAMAASAEPDAEDLLLATEIGKRLAEAVAKLSLRQRAVFTLRHDEDRSLEEIAEILKLDVGTVKAHLFRAVQKLRVELQDLYGMKRANACVEGRP